MSHTQTRTSRGASRPARLSPFLRGLSGYETVIAPFLTNGFGGTGREISESVKRESRLYRVSARPGETGGSGPGPVARETSDHRGPEPAGGGRFRAGQRVLHPAIGPGVIEKIITGPESERAVVEFENGARLILDLRIAQLEAAD
jgi:hypothetical protein